MRPCVHVRGCDCFARVCVCVCVCVALQLSGTVVSWAWCLATLGTMCMVRSFMMGALRYEWTHFTLHMLPYYTFVGLALCQRFVGTWQVSCAHMAAHAYGLGCFGTAVPLCMQRVALMTSDTHLGLARAFVCPALYWCLHLHATNAYVPAPCYISVCAACLSVEWR